LPDQCQTASYASVFGGECRFSLFYNTGGGLVLHGVKRSKKRFLRYITRERPLTLSLVSAGGAAEVRAAQRRRNDFNIAGANIL